MGCTWSLASDQPQHFRQDKKKKMKEKKKRIKSVAGEKEKSDIKEAGGAELMAQPLGLPLGLGHLWGRCWPAEPVQTSRDEVEAEIFQPLLMRLRAHPVPMTQ